MHPFLNPKMEGMRVEFTNLLARIQRFVGDVTSSSLTREEQVALLLAGTEMFRRAQLLLDGGENDGPDR